MLEIEGPDITMNGGGIDQNVIVLAYDTAGRRRRLARPRTSGDNPPRELWEYQWDQNGNLKVEIAPDGKQTRYEYDEHDRMVLKDFAPFASPPVQDPNDYKLVYDVPLADGDPNNNTNNIGYLAEIHSPQFITRMQRSVRGFPLVRQIVADGAIAFGSTTLYDRRGRVKFRSFPDGAGVSYQYDDAALTKILLSTPEEVDAYLCASPPCSPLYGTPILDNVALHAIGAVEAFRHVAPDIDVAWTYPNAEGQRPGHIQAIPPSGTPIQDLLLDYDPSGNVLSVNDATARNRDRAFTYDSRHRLKDFITDNDPIDHPSKSYAYDPAGNLTTTPSSLSGSLPTLRYGGGVAPPDAVTKLESAGGGGPSVSYDGRGNRTSRLDGFGSTPATWSDDNRLLSVDQLGLQIFRYDFDGRRTRYTGGKNLVYLDAEYEVNLSASPTTCTPASTKTHTKHVFIAGARAISLQLCGEGSDGDPDGDPVEGGAGDLVNEVHLFRNHTGSTDVTTASDGTGGIAYLYEPWGELRMSTLQGGTVSSPAPTRYLFAGLERHDLMPSLYYASARYYDSRTGRFLSEDPALVGGIGGLSLAAIQSTPQAQNAYAYALNRPSILIDPSGRFTVGDAEVDPALAGFIFFAPGPLNPPAAVAVLTVFAVGATSAYVIHDFNTGGPLSQGAEILKESLLHGIQILQSEELDQDVEQALKEIESGRRPTERTESEAVC